jgi:hypothetical protein
MTEQDYTNVLDYLLTKLRDLQLSEISEEINNQINRGKTLTLRDEWDLKEKNIKQSEVGKTQTLPLTSKEAFEVAINYLSKVIVDVPNYSKKIIETFGQNIIWEYDQTQSIKSLNASEGFAIDKISLDVGEIERAKIEFQKLKNYINE